jgi:glycosyltransferase involved in cell wall biosynthesis
MDNTPPKFFPGRLALQQRVLPAYRAPFFDLLARACQGGLSVFAGYPLHKESIAVVDGLLTAHFAPARNWHLLDPSSPGYLCWQGGLLPWLEAWQPEALIVEANPRYRSTPAAARWMHARQRPVIGWGLGAPPLKGRLAAWRARSRRQFFALLDGVIAYSQAGAQEYIAAGFPPERVFTARNAVAPRPNNPPLERPPGFVGRAQVIFVGRLQARKRLDLLLQACAALPEAQQPRLAIVGDGPARLEFERLAQRIYPSAKFLGAQHGEALSASFAAADLFVLPGTGGLAVQQAMAHSLPVIVAEADGTQNDLVQPETGWLIPPGDLGALVDALQQALSDAPRLRRMGQASYQVVSQEVNLEAMVEVFLQALEAVSGRS